MPPPLTLFYCPGHLSFAPHVILNELGLPFKLKLISIINGDTQTEQFKRLNPKGKVPILLTPDGVLTESSAILIYLALSYPESGLLPNSSSGVAKAIEWLNWLNGILASTVALNLHPQRFSAEPAAHEGIRIQGRREVIKTFQQIDCLLGERQWALGECYSVVDSVLLIFFKWGNLLKLDMSVLTHWNTHALNMLQRPAVQKTLYTEKISIWE